MNENNDFDAGIFTEKAETWSLGCCLYYLVTKMDPFEGSSVRETKQNIMKLRINHPKEPLDPIVNSLIMKCFERNPEKRLDVKGIIKYLDSLEMINYGDYISQLNYEKLLAASLKRDEVADRAKYDRLCVDYTGKSLDLRNNPWFFSKNYSYSDRPEDGSYPIAAADKEHKNEKQANPAETRIQVSSLEITEKTEKKINHK